MRANETRDSKGLVKRPGSGWGSWEFRDREYCCLGFGGRAAVDGRVGFTAGVMVFV